MMPMGYISSVVYKGVVLLPVMYNLEACHPSANGHGSWSVGIDQVNAPPPVLH